MYTTLQQYNLLPITIYHALFGVATDVFFIARVLENMFFTSIKPTTQNRALSTTSFKPATDEVRPWKHVLLSWKTWNHLSQADTILPWTKTTSVMTTPAARLLMVSTTLLPPHDAHMQTIAKFSTSLTSYTIFNSYSFRVCNHIPGKQYKNTEQYTENPFYLTVGPKKMRVIWD